MSRAYRPGSAQAAVHKKAKSRGRHSFLWYFFRVLLVLGLAVLGVACFFHFKAGRLRDRCADIVSGLPEEPGPSDNSDAVDELREEFSNPDVIGVLEIPELGYYYPVCQARDNEYYLYHDAYGNWDYNGTIFLDASCSGDFSDQTNVLYGHNMAWGVMFGWMGPHYLQSSQGITGRGFRLHLEDGTLEYSILCATTPESYDEQVYLLDAGEGMEDFYQKLSDRAELWNKDVAHDGNSRTLSLMTCYGTGVYYRFGVTGIENAPGLSGFRKVPEPDAADSAAAEETGN